jgi:hypothetical protein
MQQDTEIQYYITEMNHHQQRLTLLLYNIFLK